MELVTKVEKELSEEDVAQYLKNHSGFFLKRDDLLLELALAHPSGDAVSLLERQVSVLRERNMEMRSRLNDLLNNAQGNDQLFDKTKQLTLSLIESQGLDSIVNTFNRSLLSDFSMDFSCLTLFGNPEKHRSINSRMVCIDDAYQKIPGLLKSTETTCGVLRPEELSFLFSEQADKVKSAAVVPLSHGKALGVIGIGSKDPNYFGSDLSTLFLSYIGDILSRILPRYIN